MLANSGNAVEGTDGGVRPGRTGGPLGTNRDAGDPDAGIPATGDTGGPVGSGDHGDPEVLAILAPTLSSGRREDFGFAHLESMSTSDFASLGGKPATQRYRWVRSKLETYSNQFRESAAAQDIPVQLLVVIVLNELVDIDWKDLIEENFELPFYSVGIAQIQPKTALEHHLIPEDNEFKNWKKSGIDPRVFVKDRLRIPQYAIEAAAREIRFQLDRLREHPDSRWAAECGFYPGRAGGGQDLYKGSSKESQEGREMEVAKMIAAAYNSPDIIIAKNPLAHYQTNAIPHGNNAATLASVLYHWKIARPGTKKGSLFDPSVHPG